MPPPALSSSAPPARRRKRWILGGLLGVIVGLLAALFIARAAALSYLRSDRFREFLARQTGDTLHAETQLAPLHFEGLNLYSERFAARGGADAAFSSAEFEHLRAEVRLRRFSERVWQVETLEIQRAQLDLQGPRIELPLALPGSPRAAGKSFFSGWLPNRVELGSATIRELDLRWKEGALSRTALHLTPGAGGWDIAGNGGQIVHAGWPALEVQALQLRFREPSLFIQKAELRQPAGGTITANGEVQFGQRLDLHAKLDRIPITPFLEGDWRVRLLGNASGEIDVRSDLPALAAPRISGTLQLGGGQLTALPVLDQIALFTRTQQFRRLALSRASAEFEQLGSKLHVTKFIAESERLIRIEGSFTVERSRIDGAFQVGVTPASLQWLPGSQARVFTEARDGYLWSPMRLTGPLENPTEDLTPRLAAAAQGAVLEQVETTVRDTLKTGKDAVKSALDLLLPGK